MLVFAHEKDFIVIPSSNSCIFRVIPVLLWIFNVVFSKITPLSKKESHRSQNSMFHKSPLSRMRERCSLRGCRRCYRLIHSYGRVITKKQ
jgi:hypothetical protein